MRLVPRNHTFGTLATASGGTPISPLPEPSGLALLGTGLVAGAGAIRRKLTRR